MKYYKNIVSVFLFFITLLFSIGGVVGISKTIYDICLIRKIENKKNFRIGKIIRVIDRHRSPNLNIYFILQGETIQRRVHLFKLSTDIKAGDIVHVITNERGNFFIFKGYMKAFYLSLYIQIFLFACCICFSYLFFKVFVFYKGAQGCQA
jgi:hypothetical protein